MSEVESPKFALPETALSPEDYVRVSVKMTKRRFHRTAVGYTLSGGMMLLFGLFGLFNNLTTELLTGIMIGFGSLQFIFGINLFSGSAKTFAKLVQEPENANWLSRTNYVLTVSGIEMRNTTGFSAFHPWSLVQRWEIDSEHGVTIFVSGLGFIFLHNAILTPEAYDFITRHLGAQMPASP